MNTDLEKELNEKLKKENLKYKINLEQIDEENYYFTIDLLDNEKVEELKNNLLTDTIYYLEDFDENIEELIDGLNKLKEETEEERNKLLEIINNFAVEKGIYYSFNYENTPNIELSV